MCGGGDLGVWHFIRGSFFTSDNLSVQVFIEMPFTIKSIECPTHKIKIKVCQNLLGLSVFWQIDGLGKDSYTNREFCENEEGWRTCTQP